MENKEISQEYVGLFTSYNESKSKSIRIEINYLSSKYSLKISDIISYYSANHMSFKQDKPDESEIKMVLNYNFIINDIYNIGLG
jgi:hypothetical protein